MCFLSTTFPNAPPPPPPPILFDQSLKVKNSHIASYQNFICQSPMIISEVLSISLDQQIVYQNDMNKTWLYTHIMSRTVFM